MTEYAYTKIMRKLLTDGVYREGRNGGTYGLFGEQMRFDLSAGFPLLTTKKVFFKGVVVELLWFLHGDTNVKYLHEHGVHIWDEWVDEQGNLGPVYGAQWRQWQGQNRTIDQIKNVVNSLKIDPYGRRHIVTAWNPDEIDNMALPPCHCLFQFHVANGRLNCQLYQRSADWFLGVPFNIASYALLTHMVAREVGLKPGEFVHTFGDLHLYANHVEAAREQLCRTPRDFPKLAIDPFATLFGAEPQHFQLVGYDPHPVISAEVSA